MLSGAPVINLVVNCTARKTVRTGVATVASVRSASLETRLARWIKALSGRPASTVRGRDLYSGDSWSVTREVAESPPSGLKIEWAIASAGYGLVRPDETLVPYAATFTRGKADSVLRPDDPSTGAQRWWEGLCAWRQTQRRRPASLQDLAAQYPERPLVVALSAEYLRALTADLVAARAQLAKADRLIVISAGHPKEGPLEANLLPCDARMQLALGGVRSSLNARIVRHLLTTTAPKNLHMSHLRAAYEAWLAQQPPIASFDRRKLDDEAVAKFIARALRAREKPSHSALLHILRKSGRACGQERFRKLFLRAEEAFSSRP